MTRDVVVGVLLMWLVGIPAGVFGGALLHDWCSERARRRRIVERERAEREWFDWVESHWADWVDDGEVER